MPLFGQAHCAVIMPAIPESSACQCYTDHVCSGLAYQYYFPLIWLCAMLQPLILLQC